MSSKANGDFETKYGVAHARYPGPFKPYENLNVYQQTDDRQVVLQGSALRAFKAAEQRVTPPRMKRKGKTRHILITGSGYRSYDLQKKLWDSDHVRFADPDESNHVEALAVDVDTGQRFFGKTTAQTQALIHAAMEAEGFHFAVEGEPWHGSFRIPG
jgi:hypothetical protein